MRRQLLVFIGCFVFLASWEAGAHTSLSPVITSMQAASLAVRYRGWSQQSPAALSSKASLQNNSTRARQGGVDLHVMRQALSVSPWNSFFWALAMPTMLLGNVISVIGNSVALGGGDPATMWGWGLAGVISTTAGHLIAQSFAIAADTGGGNPLYGGILLSLAINVPFISYSIFTMVMGVNPRVAGYLGIALGALSAIGPILITAPSLGPASIILLSTSLVGVATLVLGFAALGQWGVVRTRTFRRRLVLLPWIQPTQDGFASGFSLAGRF